MGKVFSNFYIDMVKCILKQLHVFTYNYICIYENVYQDEMKGDSNLFSCKKDAHILELRGLRVCTQGCNIPYNDTNAGQCVI